MLFRYREEKIQKELIKIEEERRMAEFSKLRAREESLKLKRYNE